MRWHLILAAAIGTCWVPLSGTAAPDETAAWLKDGLMARAHFAGTERILADTSDTNLEAIAELPQTAAMREEAFGKLALAPYKFLRNRTATTNNESALIRPLLDDLFRAESFMELMDSTNEVPEMVFALKLNEARARMWRTNLATVLIDWCGLPVTGVKAEGCDGWELRKHHDPNVFRFFRAGDWVVLGWGKDELHLQPAVLRRIGQTTRPVDATGTNWLDAWVDWPALARHQHAPGSVELPAMRLQMQGRKDFVRSVLTMKFDAPLGLKLNPWRIPTNIIHNPMVSFTATRGLAPRLNETAKAKELNVPPLPDQVYVWALSKSPAGTQMVAPVTDGSNFMRQLEPGLLPALNTFLSEHGPKLAGPARPPPFTASQTNDEIEIHGMPILSPHLGVFHDVNGEYLLGGLIPPMKKEEPLPPELLNEIAAHSNLIYYGWEFTGERLQQWHGLFQLGQLMFNLGAPSGGTAGGKWIQAVLPKMRTSGTEALLTAPDEVTVVRNSTVSFTGVELSALAYWLDSPGFPFRPYQEAPQWRSVPAGQPAPAPGPKN